MVTTVLIADSHPLYCEGVRCLLEGRNDFKIIAEAHTPSALHQLMNECRPELVIIDYNHAEFIGLSDLRLIREQFPSIRIVVISSNEEKEEICKVLDLGIHAYLTKECGKAQIMRAIEAAAAGEIYLCSDISHVLLNRKAAKPTAPTQLESLTLREREIANLVGQGQRPYQIADALSISVHTVRTHIKNIMRKLGMNKASELALYVADSYKGSSTL